jgi:glycosyltransferase involved in cell wall biosynthesis
MNPQTRPRLVTTVHGFYSVNAYSAVMTKGERVIAVSESTRDYLTGNYPRTPKDIVRVIPRGIEPSDYSRGFRPDAAWLKTWQHDFPQLAGKRVLTLPGRITRLKGHEDFMRLVAALLNAGESVHGLIVGDVHPKKREYLNDLHALAEQLKLSAHITFTGHRADLREILSVSDMVCSLSTQPEAFGRTTLEALALGRPVAAYDHGGVGEQLHQFFPEGCVPLGDAERLLQTAQAVLRNRHEPKPVGEPFTLAAMCRATLAVYCELNPD